MSERERRRRARFARFMGEYYAARQADLERLERETAMYSAEIQDYFATHGRPMYFRRWLEQSRGIPR